MGIFGMSGCNCGCAPEVVKSASKQARQKNKQAAGPVGWDPSRFEILETYEFARRCIVRIKYEDATNFEGEKILMFDATADEVRKQKVLDPHFCEGDHLSPTARFKPTEWRLAKWSLHMWFAL